MAGGAVYTPEELIEPRIADQVTALLVVPETSAVKLWDSPALTLRVVGAIVKVIVVPPVPLPLASLPTSVTTAVRVGGCGTGCGTKLPWGPLTLTAVWLSIANEPV